MLDRPSRSGRNRGDRFRLAVERLNLRNFIRFLKDERWDLVINTHFLPAEIIAALRKKEGIRQLSLRPSIDLTSSPRSLSPISAVPH